MSSLASPALIIGCGKQKVWRTKPWLGAVPARDVYTGSLFRICRRYAETHYSSDWYILSAFYGLVRPEQELLDYDTVFSQRDEAVISEENLSKQCATLLAKYDVIVSLAGKAYNQHLQKALSSSKRFEVPLKSKNLFERMAWLKGKL